MTWRLPFQWLLHHGVDEGATPFPGLLHFTLDPYFIMYIVLRKVELSTIFWVFGMTQPGIEPWSPEPLANTLLIRPMVWFLAVFMNLSILLDVVKVKKDIFCYKLYFLNIQVFMFFSLLPMNLTNEINSFFFLLIIIIYLMDHYNHLHDYNSNITDNNNSIMWILF